MGFAYKNTVHFSAVIDQKRLARVLILFLASNGVELTREEEKALRGGKGEALASAYRILVAIGEATGAKKLVPVKWAHVSGVNYKTIGDAGLEFLDKFSREARVAVKTTVNPMGYDRSRPEGLSEKFIEKQSAIVEAYERSK